MRPGGQLPAGAHELHTRVWHCDCLPVCLSGCLSVCGCACEWLWACMQDTVSETCRHVRRQQYYVLVEYNCPHIAVLCALSQQLSPLHVLCAHKRETCIVILQAERWNQETEAPPLSHQNQGFCLSTPSALNYNHNKVRSSP